MGIGFMLRSATAEKSVGRQTVAPSLAAYRFARDLKQATWRAR